MVERVVVVVVVLTAVVAVTCVVVVVVNPEHVLHERAQLILIGLPFM